MSIRTTMEQFERHKKQCKNMVNHCLQSGNYRKSNVNIKRWKQQMVPHAKLESDQILLSSPNLSNSCSSQRSSFF